MTDRIGFCTQEERSKKAEERASEERKCPRTYEERPDSLRRRYVGEYVIIYHMNTIIGAGILSEVDWDYFHLSPRISTEDFSNGRRAITELPHSIPIDGHNIEKVTKTKFLQLLKDKREKKRKR